MIRLKQFTFFVFFTFCMSSFSGFGQRAVDYMDQITGQTKKIQLQMWSYTNAVAHGKSARKVEKKRAELLTVSLETLTKVKAMKPFNGSSAFRDSVVSFLEINYEVLKEDYVEILNLENTSESSFDNMEAYLDAQERANKKVKASAKMVATQQELFAEANEVELVEGNGDLWQKMDVANRVYGYYNKIYLIFFKNYLKEGDLLEAITNRDMAALRTHQKELSQTAAEGLSDLEKIKPFEDDNSLVTVCRDLLNFYKDEADNKVVILTDFYEKNAAYVEAEKAFKEIEQGNKTQADVDKFNAAVSAVNKASEAFNEANTEMNNGRNETLTAWNETVAAFTDKHVPKGKAK